MLVCNVFLNFGFTISFLNIDRTQEFPGRRKQRFGVLKPGENFVEEACIEMFSVCLDIKNSFNRPIPTWALAVMREACEAINSWPFSKFS